MAGFDPELDKTLWSEEKTFDTTKITVSVKQYNEGIKKIQISRENPTKEGEFRFAKLGRMTKEESEAVLPLMQTALENM